MIPPASNSLTQPSEENKTQKPNGRIARIRKRLRPFFNRPAVEIAIGLLVLASVLMTLLDIYYDSLGIAEHDQNYQWLNWCHETITAVFIIE